MFTQRVHRQTRASISRAYTHTRMFIQRVHRHTRASISRACMTPAHRHTDTRAHRHRHTRTQTHPHTDTDTDTRAHRHTHTQTHRHTCTQTHTRLYMTPAYHTRIIGRRSTNTHLSDFEVVASRLQSGITPLCLVQEARYPKFHKNA